MSRIPTLTSAEKWDSLVADAKERVDKLRAEWEAKPKLTRNALQCNKCGDVIESKHVHDMRWCKCRAVAVDGGLEYARRVWRGDHLDAIDLCEYDR